MLTTILRKEHKNQWEKRAALTPEAVANLHALGFCVDVESSDVRIYSDTQYSTNSAKLFDSPNNHQLVIGIKEPPIDSIQKHQVQLCFSHTLKGQSYNMPLLQRIIDQQATLLDYELMTDDNGKRTIAFGHQAGIAGAVDSLWIAGQKLKMHGKSSPLTTIKQTIHYQTIASLEQAFANIDIQSGNPVRILIIGTGNVSQGAEQVCQWLNLPKLDVKLFIANKLPLGSWYTVISSPQLYQRKDGGGFEYREYLEQGHKIYESTFETLLGRFDILLQTAFWTDFYPRHLNNEQIMRHQSEMPWVIGDISCDIEGNFISTQKASSIDAPAFSYDARTGKTTDGISCSGVTVMSIDNLPCELSLDASEHFSTKLEIYTPHLMRMNLSLSFKQLNLIEEIKKSVIVYKGELTKKFHYLTEFL